MAGLCGLVLLSMLPVYILVQIDNLSLSPWDGDWEEVLSMGIALCASLFILVWFWQTKRTGAVSEWFPRGTVLTALAFLSAIPGYALFFWGAIQEIALPLRLGGYALVASGLFSVGVAAIDLSGTWGRRRWMTGILLLLFAAVAFLLSQASCWLASFGGDECW